MGRRKKLKPSNNERWRRTRGKPPVLASISEPDSILDHIKKKILLPLLKYQGEEESLGDFWARIFNTNFRTFDRHLVRHQATMPGVFLVQGCLPQNTPERRVLRRMDVILVRRDSRYPDVIDVSCETWGHNVESVFRLTAAQWAMLRPHLSQPIPDIKVGLSGPGYTRALYILKDLGFSKEEAVTTIDRLKKASSRRHRNRMRRRYMS